MPDVTFRDLQKGFRELGLTPQSRVIAHVSLSAFGHVRGGAETVVGALRATCSLVMMPTFTYQSLIRPRLGPPNNGMTYGDFMAENAEAEMFQPDLPAHADMGLVAETLRRTPGAIRSTHPTLSFAALGEQAAEAMAAQTLADPFGPIADLEQGPGDVLLLGVTHTVNTSLHLAERRAGRKTFTRWALTPQGVVECPNWPGDSAGFDALAPQLTAIARSAQIGNAHIQRLPVRDLLQIAEGVLRADPLALLCSYPTCDRCQAIRAAVAGQALQA
jgi:aminoglycoside 3-N-acetyltransferase